MHEVKFLLSSLEYKISSISKEYLLTYPDNVPILIFLFFFFFFFLFFFFFFFFFFGRIRFILYFLMSLRNLMEFVPYTDPPDSIVNTKDGTSMLLQE